MRACRRGMSPPSALPISARQRWCGIAQPAHRSTTRLSGRTGAPPRIATNSRPRAASRCLRARPAWCSTPIFPGPNCTGSWPTFRASAQRRGPASWRSARSIPGSSGICPAANPITPTRATLRARCSTTSTRVAGTRSCSRSSTFHDRCCLKSGHRVEPLRKRRAICSPATSRSAASPAISRRPCSASAAFRRAWSRTRTAPAASCS